MTLLGSYAEILEALGESTDRRIIGIVGSPGAGKSTIAARLAELIPDAVVLPMDGYHLPQARLVELGRRERMGAADTFDVPAFVAAVRKVREGGGPVLARGFDREVEEPVEDAVLIPPSATTVIVEGNYLLLDSGGWEAVAPLLDVSLYVDVTDSLRLDRLTARHEAFGKSAAAAAAWARGPDAANARIIATTASRADHSIAGDTLR